MAEAFDPYHTWLGIPPEQQPPDHYRLLGIRAFETNPDVIENAADRQMAHLRTFQSGRHSVLSQKLLNEVATAKVCLLNAEKQAAYDQKLRQQVQPTRPQAEPELDGLFQQAAPATVQRTVAGATRAMRATRVAKKSRSNLALYLGVAVVVAVVVVAAVLISRPSGETPIAGTPSSNNDPQPPQTVGRSPDVRKPSPPETHKQAVGRTQQAEPNVVGIQTADVAVRSPSGRYAPLVVGEFHWMDWDRYYWHEVPAFVEEGNFVFWQGKTVDDGTTFEVLTDGPVLLACTMRGGWKSLLDEGWSKFATGLSDARADYPPPSQEYIILSRDCMAGKVFTYRTETPIAPLIICSAPIPGDKIVASGKARTQSSTVAPTNVEKPAPSADTSADQDKPSEPPVTSAEKQPVPPISPTGKEAVQTSRKTTSQETTERASAPRVIPRPVSIVPPKVSVSGMKPVPFTVEDPSLIPEILQGATTFTFIKKSVKNGVLEFSVEETGVVYLVATWRYEGNRFGGWYEERLTRDELVQRGWKDMGQCPWSDATFLFRKVCNKGDSYRIRTNKYGPPKLILPRASIEYDPTPEEELAVEANERLPVPSDDVQRKITSQLAQVYDLAKDRRPSEKLRLAGELFNLGINSKKPDEKYVLLDKAAVLASESGNAAWMLRAVDTIGASFEVDVIRRKAEMLDKFAAEAKSTEQVGALVESVDGVIDEALADERYELAVELANRVYRACRKTPGRDFRKQALQRRKQVQTLAGAWKELDQARARLKTTPDDPNANLALGRWYAFTRGDWQKGLPHLAKADDDALEKLARQELTAPPTKPDDQIKLADAWWDLAETRTDEEKDALLVRSSYWYEMALPKVTSGLVKVKIEKRLGEIAEQGRADKTQHRPIVQEGNVALASNGTTVSGNFHPGRPGSALIDGKTATSRGPNSS